MERRTLKKKISAILKRSFSNPGELPTIISIPYSSEQIEQHPLPTPWIPPTTSGLHSPDSANFSDSSGGTNATELSNELGKRSPVIYQWKSSPVQVEPRRLRTIRRAQTEGAATMSANLLNPRFPLGTKLRQIQDAKRMQDSVAEKARKKGIDTPDYEFYELIGKGSYGRVYKCKNRSTQLMCAVKIIEVDQTDYRADVQSRDDSLKEFIRETSILRQLTSHNVKNVNVFYDAFSVDTQLWIITQYCPGGSLATLMKADNRPTFPGLEEKYIIAIAREVVVALKSVHAVGIIHRDIKCANILVTEDGRIQLCDFGISNVLENQVSKRSTIIGTPHWMAPELVSHLGSDIQSIRYGTEIDCWAFGCAVYEMASGFPPNARVHPGELGLKLHSEAPRLEGDRYSTELKDFVAFLLEERADKRPSASQILEHKYLKDTEQKYPTESIRDLIEYFAKWESEGGQRASLFNPFGAAGPTPISASEDPGEWNFSTTLEFDKRMSMGLDPFNRGDGTGKELSTFDQMVEEQRVMRGGAAMKGIFSMDEKPYGQGEAGKNVSDLPFRNLDNGPVADRTTLIDIDAVIPSFDEGPGVSLDNVPTIRARRFLQSLGDDEDDNYSGNRASDRRATQDWRFPFTDDNPNRRTQDWTFPKMAPGAAAMEANSQTSRKISDAPPKNRDTRDWKFPTAEEFAAIAPPPPRVKPSLVHAKTMPVPVDYSIPSSMASSPDRTSMIDLDAALSVTIPDIPRPATADSSSYSAITDMTSGDPFDLEQQIQLSQTSNRASFHNKSQSEPTAGFPGVMQQVEDDGEAGSETSSSTHNRSSSMNRSNIDRDSSQTRSSASWYRNMDPRWSKSTGMGTVDNRSSNTSYSNISYGAQWDPFSGAEATLEDRLAWERQFGPEAAGGRGGSRGGRGVNKSSTGSARLEDMGGTLRPPRPGGSISQNGYGGAVVMNGGLRAPREANKSALLPGVDRRFAEEELSLLFEELGVQADAMMQLLSALPIDDDASDGGSVKEAVVGAGGFVAEQTQV